MRIDRTRHAKVGRCFLDDWYFGRHATHFVWFHQEFVRELWKIGCVQMSALFHKSVIAVSPKCLWFNSGWSG